MKAAVLREHNTPLLIENVDISKPKGHEILIRTSYAGVCHSDLHIIEGSYPFPIPIILGHEAAGIVEQVGDKVTSVKPGDHVITCISAYCGHCEHCLTGHMSLCEANENARDEGEEPRLSQASDELPQFVGLASFAEQMLVHERAAVKIREDMPLDRASVIGCAVTTGMGAVHHTAKVEPGSTVAVIGCGGIGLSAVNGAAIAGAGRVIAVDTNPIKLDFAKEFGATDTVNASDGDPVQQVRELTGGGVHYSFEAVGLKPTTEQAFKMLRAGGTATVIGMIPVGTMVEFHGPDFLSEKKIQGCMMGSNRFPIDMPRYIDFYMAGKLHLDKMISQTLPFEKINEAFDDLKAGKVARTVLKFD